MTKEKYSIEECTVMTPEVYLRLPKEQRDLLQSIRLSSITQIMDGNGVYWIYKEPGHILLSPKPKI